MKNTAKYTMGMMKMTNNTTQSLLISIYNESMTLQQATDNHACNTMITLLINDDVQICTSSDHKIMVVIPSHKMDFWVDTIELLEIETEDWYFKVV